MADETGTESSWLKTSWNWGKEILSSFASGPGADVATAAGQSANDSVAGELGVKFLAKKVLAKRFPKFVVMKIPVLGAAVGLYYGGQAAWRGDWQGAVAEVASGFAAAIPIVGTFLGAAIDVAKAYRDVEMQVNGRNPWDSVPVLNLLPAKVSKDGIFTAGGAKPQEAATTPAATQPAVTTPAVTTPAVTTPAVTTPAAPPPAPDPKREEYANKFANLATDKPQLRDQMKTIALGMPPEALEKYIEGLSGYDAQGIKKEGIKFEDSLAAKKGLLAGTPTPAQKQAIRKVRASIKDKEDKPIDLTPTFQQVRDANKGKPAAETAEAPKTEPAKPTPEKPSTTTQQATARQRESTHKTQALRADPPPRAADAEYTETLEVGKCSNPAPNGKYVCLGAGGRPTQHTAGRAAESWAPSQVNLRAETLPPEASAKEPTAKEKTKQANNSQTASWFNDKLSGPTESPA